MYWLELLDRSFNDENYGSFTLTDILQTFIEVSEICMPFYFSTGTKHKNIFVVWEGY